MEHARFRIAAAAVGIVLASATSAAGAQWAWREADGRMVYSDRAPPKSVPDKQVLRRPEVNTAPLRAEIVAALLGEQATEEKAPVAKPAPKPAAPTVADREIASRKRQQELAEAEKKAAAEEARKTQNAQNCERMRGYLRALDDGQRIARVNTAGEREVLDDSARAAETQRVREQLDQNCR